MASKVRSDADYQERDSAIVSDMFEEPPTLSENADEPPLEPEPLTHTQKTDQHLVNCSPVQVTSNSGASFMHGEHVGVIIGYSCGCHIKMDIQQSEFAQRRLQALQNVSATDANELGKINTKFEELQFQFKQEKEQNGKLRATIRAREEEKKKLEQQKNDEIKILKNTIETMKIEKAATEKDTEERNRKYEEEIKKLEAQIRSTAYKHTKKVCWLSQEISTLKHELKDQTIQLITREKQLITREKELAESRQRTAELTADLEIIAREKAEAKVKILETKLAQQQTQQQTTPPDPTASSDDAVSSATNNSGEGCFGITSVYTRSSACQLSTDDLQ